MTENELKVLLDAVSLAKIDPAGLKPVNPFTQQGPTAKSLQVAVQEINATQAARWRNEAGESISLAAAAAKAGLVEMSRTVHEELSWLDADYITGQQESAAQETLTFWLHWKKEQQILRQCEKSNNSSFHSRLEETPAVVSTQKISCAGLAFKTLRS